MWASVQADVLRWGSPLPPLHPPLLQKIRHHLDSYRVTLLEGPDDVVSFEGEEDGEEEEEIPT